MSKRVKLSQNDVDWLRGYLSAFDDLPDGAWSYACQDAIESSGKFKGRDPYDVWIAYVEATSEGAK
jgi:hypothetical protein